MYALPRAALFTLEAERAHDVSLAAIGRYPGLNQVLFGRYVPRVPIDLMGLSLANPIGVAAGLDKNGAAIDGLAGLGFGFVEVGTVTPRPQSGNSKPRVFRLPSERALINRLGFNNAGVEVLVERLNRRRTGCPVGVNLGKNRDTPAEKAVDDYRQGLAWVVDSADYVTINVSSPNTPGLRDLQESDALKRLLDALVAERDRLAAERGRCVPLAVKVAPDLTPESIAALAKVLRNAGVDGVIATNTTTDRRRVAVRWQREAGGLSGAPLREQSNAVIGELARCLDGALPIIGVGGIQSRRDAADKFAAGASGVQLYTGLIYRGPALVRHCALGAADAIS